MNATAYTSAVDAWVVLLADSTVLRMMETQFELVMGMAVALAKPQPQSAFDWSTVQDNCKTDEEEQALLSLVFAVQHLLEVMIRENMRFLIDDTNRATSGLTTGGDDQATSASQREHAAQQEALVNRLPEQFRLAFITSVRKHWSALQAAAAEGNLRISRLENMSWRVIHPFVLLRIVTSDLKQRILKVPVQQFHQLRYSTAKVLQEMHQVEAHPIMRLTNLEQSKAPLSAAAVDQRAAP